MSGNMTSANPKAIAAATHKVIGIVILSQTTVVAISLLVALPFIVQRAMKGRYKLSVGLRSEKKAGGVGFVRSVDRSARKPIGSQSSTIGTYFDIFNNKFLLRCFPWTDTTIARLIINIVVQSGVIFPMVFQNPSPPSNFKRAGWAAAVYLPMIFLLGIKNTPFALIGKSHERVNFIHRLLGPTVLFGGLAHALFFVNLKKNMNSPLVLKGAPLTGLVALISFFLLGITATPIFSFNLALFALYYHSKNLKPFIIAIGFTLGWDMILTSLKTSIRPATLTALPGGFTKVEIHDLGAGWRAGQHVYLRVIHGLRSMEKHPFTISNAPARLSSSENQSLILMAKTTGSFTKNLNALGNPLPNSSGNDMEKYSEKNEYTGRSAIIVGSDCKVVVEGPYGSSFVDMDDYETVVLFAGGSGFTYSMATLEHLVGSASLGEGITKTIFVMWALRDLDMVYAFSETLNRVIAAGRVHQMQIIMRIYKSEPPSYDYSNPVTHAELVAGRVEPSTIVQEAFEVSFRSIQERGEDRGCGIGIGVCGPEGLVKSVRNAVSSLKSPQIKRVGGVNFHSECFGM